MTMVCCVVLLFPWKLDIETVTRKQEDYRSLEGNMIPGLLFVHTDCQSGEVHGVCAVVLLSAVHVLLAGGRWYMKGLINTNDLYQRKVFSLQNIIMMRASSHCLIVQCSGIVDGVM